MYKILSSLVIVVIVTTILYYKIERRKTITKNKNGCCWYEVYESKTGLLLLTYHDDVLFDVSMEVLRNNDELTTEVARIDEWCQSHH